MKVYEYAKIRNIKSREIVKRLHELGETHVKNHLSLVPEKLLNQLNNETFKSSIQRKDVHVGIITMECHSKINGISKIVHQKAVQYHLKRKKVSIIQPLYDYMDQNKLAFLCDINVDINHQQKKGQVYQLNHQQMTYYYIKQHDYFTQKNPIKNDDIPEALAFLNLAIIELIKLKSLSFDIIHIHDWPFGLFPLLFKDRLRMVHPKTQIVTSLYETTYQGIYGKDVLSLFGLDEKYFSYQYTEYANSVNFLKTLLVTSPHFDISREALKDLKEGYLQEYVYDNM